METLKMVLTITLYSAAILLVICVIYAVLSALFGQVRHNRQKKDLEMYLSEAFLEALEELDEEENKKSKKRTTKKKKVEEE